MVQPIKVRILDQEYLIKTDEKEEQVRRVAEYVNDKLLEAMENGRGLSEKKMTILAVLDIASECFQLREERDDLLSSLRQRTETMIQNIDSVMG